MATSSNTADGRYGVTVRSDSISAARVPPAGVPAYYLGRPAHFWMAVFRPRPRDEAPPPDEAAGEPSPPVHQGKANSLASDPNGHDAVPRGLVA
jgi:hypothetical protein